MTLVKKNEYLGQFLVVKGVLQRPPLLVVLLIRAELLLLFFELPKTLLLQQKKGVHSSTGNGG